MAYLSYDPADPYECPCANTEEDFDPACPQHGADR